MTKLKNQTKKVEEAIAKLNGELKSLNKEKIQGEITSKQELIKNLEELMENEDIQKRYPKYNKMKKFFYVIPHLLVILVSIALVAASILTGSVTLQTFLVLLVIGSSYVTYNLSSRLSDKLIEDNEEYKKYYEIYGDKKYSAKRVLKDLHLTETELKTNNELLEKCTQKEQELQKFQGFLTKLNDIRDTYVEQTLQEDYSKEEIDEISKLFSDAMNPVDEIPKSYVKE